jgi:uncharacterized protein (DUF4415 family)
MHNPNGGTMSDHTYDREDALWSVVEKERSRADNLEEDVELTLDMVDQYRTHRDTLQDRINAALDMIWDVQRDEAIHGLADIAKILKGER